MLMLNHFGVARCAGGEEHQRSIFAAGRVGLTLVFSCKEIAFIKDPLYCDEKDNTSFTIISYLFFN